MNVARILQEWAEKVPEKSAVFFKEQNISFGQLKDTSFRLAGALNKLGLKKGDRVAVYLPNWPEYIYSYLAVFCQGLTAVPLDFMLTEDELVSCITHAEAKILITRPKPSLSLDTLKTKCPGLKEIIVCQEKIAPFLSFEELVAQTPAQFPTVKIEDGDYAIIFYTSGTTGKPKGVLINYRQLEAPPKAIKHFVNKDITELDTVACPLPFSHLGGLIAIQAILSFGLSMVLMERFIPSEFLRNIEKHKVNWFWLVPSMYYALLQVKEFDSFDLSSLRWIVLFGAPSSIETIMRFHQRCPKTIFYHGWGLTETNAPTAVIPTGSEKLESVGKPAPWIEIKIFSAEGGSASGGDDSDRELPVGQVGEIVVRSWVVTDGYYKDPELTAQTIRNGWFHTGDLGKFDAEGDLFIRGRKKEMIKVAGEIVFEPEVEAAMHKHPDIAEVAVVGVPDKMRGEVPKAFVVTKDAKALAEEELRYFCRQHLAHFKIPHYFEFLKELPKNRTGKIDKEKLRGSV